MAWVVRNLHYDHFTGALSDHQTDLPSERANPHLDGSPQVGPEPAPHTVPPPAGRGGRD